LHHRPARGYRRHRRGQPSQVKTGPTKQGRSAQPAGEAQSDALRLDFDRRLKLEFHGSSVTSDAGLLTYRELDDALGLMAIAEQQLVDGRTGRNSGHDLVGMLRQSVFGRLAGYEAVNDADRLGRDPAMRWIVGGKAVERDAASTSQMGRFETEWLASDENLAALTGLSGQWIDCAHGLRPLRSIVLDMDSSVSPTHGEQEGTACPTSKPRICTPSTKSSTKPRASADCGIITVSRSRGSPSRYAGLTVTW
jgi:hypothetical protein